MGKKTLKGFETLSKGTFENGGQNLYVSHNGVLQRIWRFDVNNDGYVDLLIANSHDYNERPKACIIHDPTGEANIQEVLTESAQTAAVADINGDGYDDFVIAAINNGHHGELPSYIYFGGPDGITEDRKIELAAPICTCCGVGDFNGDGKKDICYLVSREHETPLSLGNHNPRIRVYYQGPHGFTMNGYKDYPINISYFTVGDIDGDGYDDLYCRTKGFNNSNYGEWFVLWGGPDGFRIKEKFDKTDIGTPTDDYDRFDTIPFGGGNFGYPEFARSKMIKMGGKTYLFYADADKVRLVTINKERKIDEEIVIRVPNATSAAIGHIRSAETEDLVLTQWNGVEDHNVLIYSCENGFDSPVQIIPVKTPRDILLYDFSGNGHDDLAVVQGRTHHAFTSESLLFVSDENGVLNPEPKRFVTHNAIEVFAADFSGDGKRQLVFVNQNECTAYGHVPVYVYLGSKDGFSPDNRLEFPGHSAGTMIPVDFNDDGFTDILVLQNAEDQPFLEPDGDLYWGGKDGFSLENRLGIPAPLAWGGHCADINKDGYLDIIASCAGHLRIFYGGPNGYSADNMVTIHPLDIEYTSIDKKDNVPVGNLWLATADLNGDGWVDLVVPMSWRPYSRIYWGGPEGYSNERSTLLPIEHALTVRIADLNKDGHPDLIFGSRVSSHRNSFHEGTVTIFWGSDKGYSEFNCCVLPSYQSNCITIADFNNDGYLDIFASSYFNRRERDINSYIYWNDKGHFSVTNRKRIFAHSSSAAWACDFNEDGYVDICVTNHRAYGNHRTESAIWWNGPDGLSEERRSWLPTIGPHDMVPNDVGNVMTRGPEEWYISPAVSVENLKSVSWGAEIPIKTWVNCQIRTANTEEKLADAAFTGPDGTDGTRFECGDEIPTNLVKGSFVQVKLFLGAVNSGSSPRVTEICFE